MVFLLDPPAWAYGALPLLSLLLAFVEVFLFKFPSDEKPYAHPFDSIIWIEILLTEFSRRLPLVSLEHSFDKAR